jgi:sodium/hydrogen exchanger 10/11
MTGCSGVVSCVILGLKMSSDSTSISPEVEKLVHHFWEMIGYLANTVLFVLVGIIVTETALSKIEALDW